MRVVAVFLCTWLLSSTAFAQGKGGPSLDPLGDRQHGDPAESPAASKARPAAKKVRVKKRTVRVTHVQSSTPSKAAPAAPAAKPKPKIVVKPKARAKVAKP